VRLRESQIYIEQDRSLAERSFIGQIAASRLPDGVWRIKRLIRFIDQGFKPVDLISPRRGFTIERCKSALSTREDISPWDNALAKQYIVKQALVETAG
jgi:hypothetical protein